LFHGISVSLNFWYHAVRLLIDSFILGDPSLIFFQIGYPVESPTNSALKQTPIGIPPSSLRNRAQRSARYTNGRDGGAASVSLFDFVQI